MSIRRKKGDIVAITVSFIIAMFLAAGTNLNTLSDLLIIQSFFF